MNKSQFLFELRARLNGLMQDELEERIAFYSEMIDDRLEEGLTEEEAVEQIGNVDDIAAQIMGEIPLSKIVRNKVNQKKNINAGMVLLLILSFPIWFPLLITAMCLLFTFYIVIWVFVFTFFVVDLAFIFASIACLVHAPVTIFSASVGGGFLSLGCALFMAGLAILLFFGSIGFFKAAVSISASPISRFKSWILRKGANNESYS
ncbi:MAG: DUF1700 domain-containing protein [Agathobacter sp.]|uniref:DUF1700 domain-containing protein n=1 Tax=Agathobacter sp. TaxID=2021311 RepID=UPI0025876F30|nr:DUF1700 domain-containing protein [Agathobacter sp.]MCR5676717.1 DUF1700 domain-containing protein [Agathobacter sp.]